jgi:hypothetical protein
MFPGTPTAPPIMVTDRILALSAAPPRRRTAASSVGGPSVNTSTPPGGRLECGSEHSLPGPCRRARRPRRPGEPPEVVGGVAPPCRESVCPLQRPRPSAVDRNVRLAGQSGERERIRRAPGTARLAVTVDHDRGHLHVGAAKQVQKRHRVRGVHVGLDDDVPGNGAAVAGPDAPVAIAVAPAAACTASATNRPATIVKIRLFVATSAISSAGATRRTRLRSPGCASGSAARCRRRS